ncbi:hypothetical protein DAH66_21930 [Sphingomonas koreensis]|jgi:hypothetical protein|uniref:Uncharacterized protein n=1 Tax=Sphingomonas koreensis TaxID=93064 RepID=A0A2M8WC73_9SPHN|nr:hypothetical protein [Sphingomonas koreensis]PJI87957.1 hypothetical protein BDW16_1218 [Sphingomonas koreensis]PJI88492.1 hypothetical protein BDW16_1771 [Sphingomonas koreensis]RSU54864.1 hypothetical protein DAH56_20825 [Sphingomonas koreensis]RSU63126.1 hypothetical protein DAH55_20855 [Sphingomonas koreensis]RSY76328.1 hypothetical protein DAH66_21930 [Sphingomonas koreensis]
MNQNYAQRLSEAEVIGASLALVKHAGWTIQKNAQVSLAPSFWNYLYLPEPELLLVPSINASVGARFPVTRAVQEARSDAMVITIRKSRDGERQASADLAIWSSRQVLWFGPFLPWLGEGDDLWLIPDVASLLAPSFRLGGGRLNAVPRPYHDEGDRRRGLAEARLLIDTAVEG